MELPYLALFLVRKYSRPHYREVYERYVKNAGQSQELKDALAGKHAQKVANKVSEYLDAKEKFQKAKADIVALRHLHAEGKQKEQCEWSKFIEDYKRVNQTEPRTKEEWRELFGHFKRTQKGRTSEEWSALFGHFKWVIQKNEPIARTSLLELFQLVQP